MSLNNVIPAWLLTLDMKENDLSPEDFLLWLNSEEGKQTLPDRAWDAAVARAKKAIARRFDVV